MGKWVDGRTDKDNWMDGNGCVDRPNTVQFFRRDRSTAREGK